MQRLDIEDVAKKLGVDVVPIIASGKLQFLSDMVAKGFNSQWGEFLAEGIVAKPEVEVATRQGRRIITKLKHKDFLKL